MSKLWTGTDGKLILTDCPECPCGGTSGTIDTDCCPDNLLQETLYIDVTHSTLGFLGTITVTHTGVEWEGSGVFSGCTLTINALKCVTAGGAHWDLDYGTGGGPYFVSASSESCDPFALTFSGDARPGGSTCFPAGTLTFEVSA